MKKKRIVVLHLNSVLDALSRLGRSVEIVHTVKSNPNLIKDCLDADSLLIIGADGDFTNEVKFVADTLSGTYPEMIVSNISIVTGAKSAVQYRGEILHVYPNESNSNQRMFLESLLSKISAGKSR